MTTTYELAPTTTEPGRPATNLVHIEQLDDDTNLAGLAKSDAQALRAVALWTRTFIAKPNASLGREGPVCPFVPVALDRRVLWLAAERTSDRSTSDIIQLIQGYQQRLLNAEPPDGVAGEHKSLVVVFTDLPATEAQAFFDGVLQEIGLSSYDDLGLVMGPFFEGNEGTALYNPNFRPFTSPVPFLLIRRAVISDWKFFLNNQDFFRVWKRLYGELTIDALADELRRLPWPPGR
jgi:hypothetical protein